MKSVITVIMIAYNFLNSLDDTTVSEKKVKPKRPIKPKDVAIFLFIILLIMSIFFIRDCLLGRP